MNIFDFFKSEKKSDKIEEFKSKNNRYKDKFSRYRFLMKNNSHENILVATYLIAIIVEYLNYSEAVQSLECEHNLQKNSLLEEIYREIEKCLYLDHNIFIFDKIHDEDKKYYNRNDIVDETPLEIDVNKFPILLNPWNGIRIVDNLLSINESNIFDGLSHCLNVQNYFLYPMDLIICDGGNHSQFAARFKNQGKTIIKEIHDYSLLYTKIEFDGVNYISKEDNSIIKLRYDEEVVFYSGVIFELGRYLFDNKYYGLTFSQKDINNIFF